MNKWRIIWDTIGSSSSSSQTGKRHRFINLPSSSSLPLAPKTNETIGIHQIDCASFLSSIFSFSLSSILLTHFGLRRKRAKFHRGKTFPTQSNGLFLLSSIHSHSSSLSLSLYLTHTHFVWHIELDTILDSTSDSFISASTDAIIVIVIIFTRTLKKRTHRVATLIVD